MMNRTLYFDMDGTIADLYGIADWLPKLQAEDPSPYAEARPLVNLDELSILCKLFQAQGGRIGVISWLSKTSSKNYDKAVRQAKKEWLKRNCGLDFDEIHIVKYGTPKYRVAYDKNGILFDDEVKNCSDWKGVAINVTENDLIEVIKNLIENLR